MTQKHDCPTIGSLNDTLEETYPNVLASPDLSNARQPAMLSPLIPEVDESGNVEYKYQILPMSRDRFNRLITQLQWRLNEGSGLCVYEIGVLDDGSLAGISIQDMRKSLVYLCAMAQALEARVELRRLMMLHEDKVSGTQTRVFSSENEARSILGWGAELPKAEFAGFDVVPESLHIHLDPTIPLTQHEGALHGVSQDAPASPPLLPGSLPEISRGIQISTRDRPLTRSRATYLQQRREYRLARFEAAVRQGAGACESITPHEFYGMFRGGMPKNVTTQERLIAEAVVEIDGDFFVDYSSI